MLEQNYSKELFNANFGIEINFCPKMVSLAVLKIESIMKSLNEAKIAWLAKAVK